MQLSNVTFLPNGLQFNEDVTFDEWQEVGEQIKSSVQGHQWWIGDWLRFGGHKWGDKYEAAAESLDMKPSSLKTYKSIAESYPNLLTRVNDCSFKHHRIVASLPSDERAEMLSLAAGFGWSASRLRSELPSRATVAALSAPPESQNEEPAVVATLDELAGQKFGCIYADPPWQYGNQATRAATGNHYGTMTIDDLCEMPVADIAADDSHLHLWTTNGFLHDAFRVLAAWGFEYRSCYVWVKPQMGIGNYWRVSHEFMLLGIRGNAKRFNVRDKMSWGEFPRTKHSAKPEEVRHLIEQVSNGPFLEIFGRRAVSGWTVLGNQVETRLFT